MVRGIPIQDQRHIHAPLARGLLGKAAASAEDVEALWELHEKPSWEPPGGPVDAYISDNRWVADCRECNSGMAVWPENPRAHCFGCGATYKVNLPPRWREAVEVLEERPARNRHWFPTPALAAARLGLTEGETVDLLRAENAAHGIGAL